MLKEELECNNVIQQHKKLLTIIITQLWHTGKHRRA